MACSVAFAASLVCRETLLVCRETLMPSPRCTARRAEISDKTCGRPTTYANMRCDLAVKRASSRNPERAAAHAVWHVTGGT